MSAEQDVCVYVIGTICNGRTSPPIKVGISNKPEARLSNFKTSSPNDLVIVQSFRLPSRQIAKDVEGCFHETQKEHHLRGEWFDIPPSTAIRILALHIRWAVEMLTTLDEKEREIAYGMVGLNEMCV